MKRSIGSYVVQFGMVAIPTTLHTVATENRSKTGLNQLHRGCGAKLNQVMVCKAHGEGRGEVVVPKEDIVKGFEYEKGKWVLIGEEDLAAIPLPSKGVVAITSFVPAHSVDAVWFEKSYILAADKAGGRPFALLARAMAEEGLIAIATITVRQKEQLCALRYRGGVLYLHPLWYDEELDLDAGAILGWSDVKEAELAMAKQLVNTMREDFDPSRYSDGYTSAFLSMVDQKVQHPDQPLAAAPAPKADSGLDFMAALQASLDAAKKKPEGAAPAAGVPTPKKSKKGAAA